MEWIRQHSSSTSCSLPLLKSPRGKGVSGRGNDSVVTGKEERDIGEGEEDEDVEELEEDHEDDEDDALHAEVEKEEEDPCVCAGSFSYRGVSSPSHNSSSLSAFAGSCLK